MNIEEFFDRIISVKTDEDGNLNIIDQTLLPGEIKSEYKGRDLGGDKEA